MITDIVNEQYYYTVITDIVSASLKSDKDGSVLLITGQPGSGKSVFLQQLHNELIKYNVEYLVSIKAEFLRKSDTPKKVYKNFLKIEKENKPKILILDSLDVLAYSRRIELQEWLYYIDKLKRIKGMTIICASRNFEAEHLYPMNEQKWSEKKPIDLLPDHFVKMIFKKLNYNYKLLSEKFLDFLKVPLHLKICTDIIQINKNVDFSDTSTLHGLYAKLFEIINIPKKGLALLIELADKMIKNRTIKLNYSIVSTTLIEELRKLERTGISGIFKIDSTNKNLSFYHQTLIDYFAALKIIFEDKSLFEFIVENNQSLFIRPVIRHIIGFLRIDSKEKLFKDLIDIFINKDHKKRYGFIKDSTKIRFHIKTAILTDIASWSNPTVEEGKLLARVFNEALDSEKLLFKFFNSQINLSWYRILKDLLVIPILNKFDYSKSKYQRILLYLVKISKELPLEVLALKNFLLDTEKNKNLSLTILDIIKNLAEADLKNKNKKDLAKFIEQSIDIKLINENYQIKEICKILTAISPDRGLKLFINTLINEIKCSDKIERYDSLISSFNKILDPIYNQIPFKLLTKISELFEVILSKKYEDDLKSLPDWPIELLYLKHTEDFGLFEFYDWYKNKTINFCQTYSDESIQLIKQIQNSKWESQKQLSVICKLQNALHYKSDILKYINNILSSDLSKNQVYLQSELFLMAIKNIFKDLSSIERKKIINKIIGLRFDDRDDIKTWIWDSLNHIPVSLRDKSVKKEIEKIRKKYKFGKTYKHLPLRSRSGVQVAQSPFSEKYLKSLGLDKLYSLLVNNRDIKERWDFEKNKFFGGITELARELAKIMKNNLNKYFYVVEKLSKDPKNNTYINWFLSEISEESLNDNEINKILELTSNIYERENLQLEVVRVLRKLSNRLTIVQFEKIKDIIAYMVNSNDPKEDKFFEYRKQGYSNNALTEGINSTRGVLAELIIILLPKFKTNFLENILSKLSKDKTISVRAVVINYLPYVIKPLGWNKCYKLFLNTFSKGKEEYSGMIAQFLRYVPKKEINEIAGVIDELKNNKESRLGEDYAVLSTIFYLREIYSEEILVNILSDKLLNKEGFNKSISLLFNQIKFDNSFDKCIRIIKIMLEKSLIKNNIEFLFYNVKPEYIDKLSPIIYEIINDTELRYKTAYYILEYLEKSILYNPLMAFDILKSILIKADKEYHNITKYMPPVQSKAPMNILNTIFECYPNKEKEALELLDKLIEFNWSGVEQYLESLDRI